MGKPRSYGIALICRSERAAIRLARDAFYQAKKSPATE
ncbi:hypothetical protein C4K34_3428 [Pseudomonas chlororaphis subsp. piscium]|nr:hypothetical protein C4K34_3428 [Pseudomonas chlororaphis subsp. piscium]AZC63806.1 hypothetical protein C4K33_3314 [Pseudomonas chlororaphis subsp. piscium]AZC70044.1 hypothetical protein C4K32_3382 [Pseudomonas chlororaphis subsp. piscium]AZC82520.1 hypothetical protein C4K30_3406 [Pseudomonas chlororaphis subsp. piscium]AZC89716.1 hypothetical protein C4K29_3415 [Pseudomonas chlororaphis subsp. piscium]